MLQSTGWQMEEERVRRSLLLPQARAAAAVGEGAAIEALGREEKAIDALVRVYGCIYGFNCGNNMY